MSDNNKNNGRSYGMAFWGFLVGGLLGGTTALLFAPYSGSETRQKIKDTAVDSFDSVRNSTTATMQDIQAWVQLISKETGDFADRLKAINPKLEAEKPTASAKKQPAK